MNTLNNEDLVERFAKDAVEVMRRTVETLSEAEQREVMNTIFAGGEPEVRVRMSMGKGQRISVVIIDLQGELHLVRAAGGSM